MQVAILLQSMALFLLGWLAMAEELMQTVKLEESAQLPLVPDTLRQPIKREEIAIAAAGIVDQALQGLLSLGRLDETQGFPRSHILDIFELHRQYGRSPRVITQVRLLAQSAGCVSRLVRDWRETARHPSRSHDARGYYMIASLAAASILIPWLLLRRSYPQK